MRSLQGLLMFSKPATPHMMALQETACHKARGGSSAFARKQRHWCADCLQSPQVVGIMWEARDRLQPCPDCFTTRRHLSVSPSCSLFQGSKQCALLSYLSGVASTAPQCKPHVNKWLSAALMDNGRPKNRTLPWRVSSSN